MTGRLALNGHLGVGAYQINFGLIVETEKGPERGPALNPNMGVDGVIQQSKLRVKTALNLVIDSLSMATWINSWMVKFCRKPDLVLS